MIDSFGDKVSWYNNYLISLTQYSVVTGCLYHCTKMGGAPITLRDNGNKHVSTKLDKIR